jgi:hypothetical protein
VISSGAQKATEVRPFSDVFNVFQLLGFKQSSENLIKDKTSSVLLNGRLRLTSYKQTVMVGEDVCEDQGEPKRKLDTVTGGDVFKAQLKRLKKK